MFGLIFGVLGMLLSNYTLKTLGECSSVLIVILAGGAGLLTGLSENTQTRFDISKAGAIAGAITGILTFVGQFVVMTANPQAYSSNNILNTFFIMIIYTLFVLSVSVLPAVGIGAVAALIAAKYRLALIAGVTAAVITYFVMPGLVSLLSQSGIFNAWSSIKSPPSGIARILGVTDATFKPSDDVWIETQDGQIFSASVCTGYSQPCGDPPQWQSTSTTPEYYSHYTSGTDCKKLGDYPLNPSGHIVECRHYLFVENDLSTEIYYALMADGSLQYFVADFMVQIILLFKFALMLLLVYITVFLSSFRLTNYLAKQIQTPLGEWFYPRA
jgi:hypothetical protein